MESLLNAKLITNKLTVDLSRCHGCGLCSICPTNAISMKIDNGRYIPSISAEICVNCKMCVKICEGIIPDHSLSIYQEIDSVDKEKNDKHFHPYVGYFNEHYVGYSTNPDIRKRSASGGLISSLLIYLLNSGKIDGAIVTKLKYNNNKVETYPFIARTEKDILDATGSFYLPVNFSNVIKEIDRQNNDEKYAIVALPCVVANLRKIKNNVPLLDRKIKYIFGLFCSNNFNYSIMNFIKNRSNLDDNLQYFNFREGWPKYVTRLKTLDKEYILDAKHWKFLFTLKMYPMSAICIICEDCTAELADISFGDAWIPLIKRTDKIGTNICITRNQIGEELINVAMKDKYIYLENYNLEDIVDAQRSAIYFKKIQAPLLRRLFKKDRYIKDNRFIPQLLITLPITLLLNRISYSYPLMMEKVPNILYKVLFYVVSICMVTGYKSIKNKRYIDQK